MKAPIVLSFVSVLTTAALHAQTSADYLVHHDFLPPSVTTYVNLGATGVLNDGTPSGSVNFVVSPIGVGVTLGGANGDMIDCGPSPLSGAQERTVSVWARTSATSGIVTPLTLGTNGNGSKWDMDIDCANGGVFELGVGNGRTTGQGPMLNDGQWHMMTAVLPVGATNLGQVRLYVDGAFVYSNSGTRAIATGPGNVIVGRSANFPTPIQWFPGDVDEAVVWSVALSDDQVQALYDVGAEPTLIYGPGQFEQLLEVYRQNATAATLGSQTWRRVTGLTGPAGLTVLPNGGYQLVLDASTGDGVAAPAAGFATSGAGCAGPAGVPTLSAPQLPVLGGTLEVAMDNVGATGLPFMVVGLATISPFPIQAIGLSNDPTCMLLVNLDAVVGPLNVTAGSASMLLPIPASQAFANAQFYFQGAQLDFATGNWSLSDLGTATLGY